MTHADSGEARDFAAAFRRFLEWVHTEDSSSRRNEVVALVADFLGADASEHSVVTREWSSFEHVNLQTALNAWSEQSSRTVTVRGITMPPHFGELELQQLVTGEHLPPLRLSAPSYVDLPNGPGSTLACLRLALLLVNDARGSYVIFVASSMEHQPVVSVQVAGLPVTDAQAVLAEIDALRAELNVYRGRLVEVHATPMGVSLTFAAIQRTARDDVVLPEAVLARIERHAFGVAEHSASLLAAGQHLKRGLLLFGPPGTGKTHTTRYLAAQMSGYTRLLLAGASLHAVSSMTELARELAPAAVVLEDVDLVAEDRSFGPGGGSVLFDLLDAMDGAAEDADLLFLLTTNRADLLEPALAARPGRVDVAVEITVPDADARARLLALYARSVPLRLDETQHAEVIERTEGVTASFLKELVRRAVLESLQRADPLTEVSAADMARALDDLLDSTQSVTRTLLGVDVDPTELASPGVARPHPVPGRAYLRGWTSYRRG
jgi:DNA polymerase III delta prime subunit